MGDPNLSSIVGIFLTIAHQSYCLVRIFENLSSRLNATIPNTDCGLEAHIMMTARTSTITALSSISASPVHQSWAHPCNVYNVFRPNISSYKHLGWV